MSRLLLGRGGGRTPDPYNDEFDLGNRGWTFVNPCDVGVTTPGRLHMTSGGAAHRARIPAMPFVVTAFLAAVTMDSLSTPGNATLAIAEASPNTSPGPVLWGPEMPDIDIPGNTALFDGRFANYTAPPTHLGSKQEAAGHVYDVPCYQQIVVHSATQMDVYRSTDNVTYTAYGTGFNPTLTPGAIVFLSFACVTEWEWLRFRPGTTSGPA